MEDTKNIQRTVSGFSLCKNTQCKRVQENEPAKKALCLLCYPPPLHYHPPLPSAVQTLRARPTNCLNKTTETLTRRPNLPGNLQSLLDTMAGPTKRKAAPQHMCLVTNWYRSHQLPLYMSMIAHKLGAGGSTL